MPVKVLVVDDSHFFQHRLKDILNEHPELDVVGLASNGQEGVDMAKQLSPDVITMDFEMPVMDGITAVRQIMANKPVPILMFSSLTYEGARITLDALEAGAVDFIPKNFAEVSKDSKDLKTKLQNRLLSLVKGGQKPAAPASPAPSPRPISPQRSQVERVQPRAAAKPQVAPVSNAPRARRGAEPGSLRGKLDILVIGASTGGPVALTEVLTKLPANFPLPIVLIQHMPENFTAAFAERLDKQCRINVREAKDGDKLRPGLALLAPGGQQLMLDKRNGGQVKVLPGNERVNYKPSLDITFGSAANSYADRVLGVVLTGMGADGCEGARLLKARGAAIWSQDEASSTIYGMPMAVAKANLSDLVLSLKDVAPRIMQEF